MTVSADVYRPAAIKQLANCVQQKLVQVLLPQMLLKSQLISLHRAIEQAKIQFADVLIVDTAGRLHVDEDMMDEIKELHAAVKPD